MGYKEKLSIILITFFFSLMGEEIMKITLIEDVSYDKLALISKIIFEENKMIAGSSYNLDEIKKIEFFEDASTNISKSDLPKTTASIIEKEQIGIQFKSSILSLTLPQKANISVAVFSLNGRKVAELFNGNTSNRVLNMDLKKHSLATGIYSVMVKSQNSLFVKKLLVQ